MTIFNLCKRLCLIICWINPIFTFASAPTNESKPNSIQEELATLESSLGGRIGVSALNTANNERIQYRTNELFPFCSTGKVMVVAAILKNSEHDPDILKKHIPYSQQDVDKSGYAPITKQHVASGMNISELCQAAIEYSDNTAANLLIAFLGGPQAVTAYAKSIKDNTFRLDRWEPELNTAIPDDVRDTTTPDAMTNSLQQLALGNALASPQREQLLNWLKNNTTGDSRIRAGTPKGWIVGDKTGTGKYGSTNDIAIIWPPHCPPIVMTVYMTQNTKETRHRDDVIATVTQMMLREFTQTDLCLNEERS